MLIITFEVWQLLFYVLILKKQIKLLMSKYPWCFCHKEYLMFYHYGYEMWEITHMSVQVINRAVMSHLKLNAQTADFISQD